MRPKSLILIVIALGCGLVASIGISQVMEGRSANANSPKIQTAIPRKISSERALMSITVMIY